MVAAAGGRNRNVACDGGSGCRGGPAAFLVPHGLYRCITVFPPKLFSGVATLAAGAPDHRNRTLRLCRRAMGPRLAGDPVDTGNWADRRAGGTGSDDGAVCDMAGGKPWSAFGIREDGSGLSIAEPCHHDSESVASRRLATDLYGDGSRSLCPLQFCHRGLYR